MSGEADLPAKLGRYELITRIGQGGMADVQLALQRGPAGFEKLVVVKLVHERLASEKSFVDMLLDEARLAALLKHPNVVDIYDLGQVEGRYFIAMEYLEGEPLLAVLRAGRDGERLDVNSTARLIADTAEGLDAAHELRSMGGKPLELVHHDISLGNIVVLYNGHVKLVDFGVAKATQSASTRTKVQGKYSYMAPEKLKGAQGDKRSDIFSLGCVLWEAITLRRLFKGANDEETMKQVLEGDIPLPSSVNADVKPIWDPIVMRALERDETKRYATAKELADDIEDVLQAERYGRKNDAIARYMQRTFKETIDARKKLLRELSDKGTASDEVLDAAFVREAGTVAPVGPERGDRSEFSIKFARPSYSGLAPVFDTAKGTPAQPPLPDPIAEEIRQRRETPTGSKPIDGGTDWATARASTGSPLLAEGTGAVAAPAPNRKKLYAGIGAVALLVVIAIVASSAGGNATSPSTIGSAVSVAVNNVPLPVPLPLPDAAVAIVAPVATDAAVEPEIVVDEPTGSAGSAVGSGSGSAGSAAKSGSGSAVSAGSGKGMGMGTGTKPVVPAGSAEELYRQGLQSFIKGDTKTALDYLRRSQKINPSFAPTWRVLGLVYERMGELPQARIAFVRYLQLAPNAADAASTKTKLDKLGK